MSHIFGPVPSRRLGRSLGVDLVPFKTCSYDCIYCQLGLTTYKTIERREWAPLDHVVAELKAKLPSQPDYITLSGSGEPTLYSRTGELIDRIKAMTNVPVAVLTNGALLWDRQVCQELMNADLVVPSLDAGDEAMFRVVNRPHGGISFETMLDGLVDFRSKYDGEYWLEVFLLAGCNDVTSEVDKLAGCVSRIKPDRVQLNTATRPTAEKYAVCVERARLDELAARFDPLAEVIADFKSVHGRPEFAVGRNEVLDMLRRRPCSVDEIVAGLGMHRNEVVKYLEELSAEILVHSTSVAHKVYYRATDRSPL